MQGKVCPLGSPSKVTLSLYSDNLHSSQKNGTIILGERGVFMSLYDMRFASNVLRVRKENTYGRSYNQGQG